METKFATAAGPPIQKRSTRFVMVKKDPVMRQTFATDRGIIVTDSILTAGGHPAPAARETRTIGGS